MLELVASMLLAASLPVSAAAVYDLPCTPVGVYPPASAPPYQELRGPTLCVVDTDIRPERARLFLDGAFIGRADDFDGRPDFLYLEPGRYRLEARLGGYRPVVFEIDAEARCRSDIRHRMERVEGEPRERRGDGPRAPTPLARVFGTSSRALTTRDVEQADSSARPSVEESGSRFAGEGRLRIGVTPEAASVYLDGVFVATGAELARLVEPLAVAPGRHVVEALLPGASPARNELELVPGELTSIELRVGE